jgi:hypothetical protein
MSVRMDGKFQRDALCKFVEQMPIRLKKPGDREHGDFGVVFINDGDIALEVFRVFEQTDSFLRVTVIRLHVECDAGTFVHSGRLVT